MKNKIAIIDIETSGLLEDMLDYSEFPYKLKKEAKLWCIVIRDLETDEIFYAEKEGITKEWLQNILQPFDSVVAHNGIKFDFLALALFGVLDYKVGYLQEKDRLFGKEVSLIDSLIVSRLIQPDRFGGHSLDSWGHRLGEPKTDYRKECIEKGYISSKDPKGFEFKEYNDLMLDYCIQDTKVGAKVFKHLMEEIISFREGWSKSLKMEHKLADLAIRREHLGFFFDKDLAVELVEDLTDKMENLRSKVNPVLPPKPMSKTELSFWTPPATQLKKDGSCGAHIKNFATKVGGDIEKYDEDYVFIFEGKRYPLPFKEPLKTHIEGDINHLDHVKMELTDTYGWIPTEWAERDFTKDSKKQLLPYDKRIKAFNKWLKETLEDNKYKKHRLEIVAENLEVKNVKELVDKIYEKLKEDYPVRLPTSPKVRVGVEKEICPNLISLGDKVEFAKDFALYLTYKHRKSTIAGGDIEEMDFNEETPEKGYLANYREVDGRIPTPAIEIGANTARYRHIGVCNVPRASSIYGKEMRSLFGCGKGAVQLGFDYASLEARIQGHYCYNYTDGKELSTTLLAEKPNDLHTLTGLKLGIPRSDAKSINYMLMYGGSWVKAKKMLNLTDAEAKKLVDNFWKSVPALKELRDDLEKLWESNGKQYVQAIDGRKLNVRSKHSIINLLFQSGGVICAKYVTVIMMEKLEKRGILIDPFEGEPEVCSMLEYHDEEQLYCNPKFFKYQRFKTLEEAEDFVANWEGAQLSDISEGKVYYVTLPNIVTEVIEESIKEMGELLGLRVPLGYAYSVSNNWYGCH